MIKPQLFAGADRCHRYDEQLAADCDDCIQQQEATAFSASQGIRLSIRGT